MTKLTREFGLGLLGQLTLLRVLLLLLPGPVARALLKLCWSAPSLSCYAGLLLLFPVIWRANSQVNSPVLLRLLRNSKSRWFSEALIRSA